MNEIFKSWKWPRKPQITDEQVRIAEHAIDRWSEVKKILDTEGWRLIKADIEDEFRKADSIMGVSPDKLADNQGYCRGVGFLLARIQSYKHAAEVAAKTLKLASTLKE
jgi:hypothetical protein